MSNNEMVLRQDNSMSLSADTARVVQEVQGAIIVAQQCPRNEQKAYTEIINACKRPTLSEQAMYSFPRGGKNVTGPSIRLAEVIARHWGNLQYGIREISSTDAETKYEAYCWDVQTNTRASRIFSQKHGRWTRKNGFKKVDDPRDVYEIVASSATRRLRACILEIIPGDIVDDAVNQCQKTLSGRTDKPLRDRVRQMVQKFSDLGVSEDMISGRLGHKIDVTSEIEIVNLGSIFKSLADGMSSVSDWFDAKVSNQASDLNNKFDDPPETKPDPKNEPESKPVDMPEPTKETDPKPEPEMPPEPPPIEEEEGFKPKSRRKTKK